MAPLLPKMVPISNVIGHKGNVKQIPAIIEDGIPNLSNGTHLLNFAAIPKEHPLKSMIIKLENSLTI